MTQFDTYHIGRKNPNWSLWGLADALGELTAAQQFRMADEALIGAEHALTALEDLPESGSVGFARATASAIVTYWDSAPSVPPWCHELHFRCQELITALNAIYAKFGQADPAEVLCAESPITLPANALRTPSEAAARLRCSRRTLDAHVESGALRYVETGHGRQRSRKMFTDNDLNAFIENQTRKDVTCPSSGSRARRSTTTRSTSTVLAFTARPKKPTSATPKR